MGRTLGTAGFGGGAAARAERREVAGHGVAVAAISLLADLPEQDAGVAHPSIEAFARPAGTRIANLSRSSTSLISIV